MGVLIIIHAIIQSWSRMQLIAMAADGCYDQQAVRHKPRPKGGPRSAEGHSLESYDVMSDREWVGQACGEDVVVGEDLANQVE